MKHHKRLWLSISISSILLTGCNIETLDGVVDDIKSNTDVIDTEEPTAGNDGGSDSNQLSELQAFEEMFHPMLVENCGVCHALNGIPPAFSDPDAQDALNSINEDELVDRDDPIKSRLTTKLLNDQHQCWNQGDCEGSAQEMTNSIIDWLDTIKVEDPTPTPLPPDDSSDDGSDDSSNTGSDNGSEDPDPIQDAPSNGDNDDIGDGSDDPVSGIALTDKALFEGHLYPLLLNTCGGCHYKGRVDPFFADEDIDVSFREVAPNMARASVSDFFTALDDDDDDDDRDDDFDGRDDDDDDNDNDGRRSGRSRTGSELVDLNNPRNSELVEEVLEGHECWSGNCREDASTIEAAISAWANRDPLPGREPGRGDGTEPTPTDPGAVIDPQTFANNLQPLLIDQCGACHTQSRRQRPFFADDSVDTALQEIENRNLINLNDVSSSRLVTKLRNQRHFCFNGGDCESSAFDMENAINSL